MYLSSDHKLPERLAYREKLGITGLDGYGGSNTGRGTGNETEGFNQKSTEVYA